MLTTDLQVRVELWAKASASVRKGITEQAERLAAYPAAALARRLPLPGIDLDG